MLKHKWTERICCVVLAFTLLLTVLFMGAASSGLIVKAERTAYETRLFDTDRVHTIDLALDDWEGFLKNCTNEEYVSCTAVIDGEKYANIGIRAKGNTSLSSVAAYGNNRYSFKIEFDHYVSGKSYYGLDKLCLNNLIQDNTYLKDYLAYTLMNRMGVASPLCSFAYITINGEDWGLYLAVEAVEDAFLLRNYGNDYGELYKPDSLSFGGGRGNGNGFDMDDFRKQFRENGSDDGQSQDGRFSETFSSNFNPFSTQERTNMTPPDMTGMGDTQSGSDKADTPDGANSFSAQGFANGMTPPDMSGMGDTQGSSNEADTPDGANSFSAQGFANGMTPPDMSGMNLPSNMMPPSGDGGQQGNFSPNGGIGGAMGSADVQLQYIDDDPSSYSNIFDNAKTDIDESDQQRLIASLKSLSEGDTSVVDQDAVIRYMAVHNFLCNDDSYTGMMVHNYYLYEKDGVMSMIPWDYNLSMGAMGGGMGMTTGATDTVNTAIDTLVTQGEMSSRPMAAWIFNDDDTIALYHTVYQEFMDKAVEEGWFTDELEKVANMIAPYVEKDPTAFCTYEEFQKGVQSLKEFCGLRCESINGQLSGTIPSTSSEQKLNSSSLIDASSINLSDMGNFNGSGTQDGAGGMKGPDFQGSGAWNQMPLPDAVPVGQEESPVSSENEPTKESAVGNSQDNPPHDMPSPMEPGESPQRNTEVAWPLLAAAILTLMIGILLTVKLKAHNS